MKSNPQLDYRPPPSPEPLHRWFLRRLAIFILTIAATIAALYFSAKLLDRWDLLDFLAQD